MPSTESESIESFLRRQDASMLSTVLLELASNYPPVMNRLHHLQMAQRPIALSTEFKKTRQSWKRSTRYHGYGEATAYGEMLETWLTEVSVEVQPIDPVAALALYEQFIELDSHWFEHADDSSGAIGMAMQAACSHWLRAAAECTLNMDQAVTKLMALFQTDHYGGREDLLRKAHLLCERLAVPSCAREAVS